MSILPHAINPRSFRSVPGAATVILLSTVLFAASCGGAAGPGGRNQGANGRIPVVAAENTWGDIASQIGGKHATVRSLIIDPNADPHLYESNAKDAYSISVAPIVVLNGAGYDDFASKLIGASGRKPIVVSAQRVMGMNAPGQNPHLWYDIEKVPAVALAIEKAFEKVDPKNAPDYKANLQTFDASLKEVSSIIDQIKARYAGQPVAYTERVPQYLLEQAGLKIMTPPGFATAVEDGNDPSPSDAAAMEELITGHKIRLLLYNKQAITPVTQRVRALAQKNGVPVVGITETLPKGETSYQSWQIDQLNAILKALGG